MAIPVQIHILHPPDAGPEVLDSAALRKFRAQYPGKFGSFRGLINTEPLGTKCVSTYQFDLYD